MEPTTDKASDTQGYGGYSLHWFDLRFISPEPGDGELGSCRPPAIAIVAELGTSIDDKRLLPLLTLCAT